MDHVQQVRAAAAQAAATLMSSSPPQPADFVMAAEVIAAYIENGRDAALALCSGDAPQEAVASVEPVSEPPIPPVRAVKDVPLPPEEPAPEPEKEADVIPLAARGTTPPRREYARRYVDRIRHDRAKKIFDQFSVAKADGHRQRLRDEAESAELLDFVLVINGEAKTLGAYLGME